MRLSLLALWMEACCTSEADKETQLEQAQPLTQSFLSEAFSSFFLLCPSPFPLVNQRGKGQGESWGVLPPEYDGAL